MIKATLSFLNSRHLLKELEKTVLVLIPKRKCPAKAYQYRPINLCNVTCKIATRILVNRLRLILDDLITENQNAFVRDRLISDNILLASELLHTIQKKKIW